MSFMQYRFFDCHRTGYNVAMFVPLTPTLQQAAQVPQMRKHGAEL